MAAFRSEYLEEWLGIRDPHASLFVSDGARKYAVARGDRDRPALGRIFARFKRFGERMSTAAEGGVEQFLMLGVGLDTRALWLPAIVDREVRVIEADLPESIERKVRLLAADGVIYPERVVALGIDLTTPDLPAAIAAAGFDRTKRSAVFMEGVTFHLPPKLNRRLLDPAELGLAPGSELTYDYWTRARVEERNRELGADRMTPFPFPDEPEALRGAMARLGYRDVEVQSVAQLASRLWPDLVDDEADAYLVEATVA